MGVPGGMETSNLAPNLGHNRPYGVSGSTVRLNRAADAFDAVAWRAPSFPRVPSLPANDVEADALNLPTWAIVTGGGVIAALLGALMGAALSL